MSTTLEYPVIKVRDDGTPAIWFTHMYWMILEPGIVRKYLDNRESLGRFRARQAQRKERGGSGGNKELKSWEFMDSWPQDQSHCEACLELFAVGFKAYGHINAQMPSRWTPEKLRDFGDRAEARGFESGTAAIVAADKITEPSTK